MVGRICDTKAFESAVNQYKNLVFSICYSAAGDYFDAEDLTQDTFLSAYKNFDGFDGKNMKAWLAKIASNKCCDYLKSSARKSVPAEDEFFHTQADSATTPEDDIIGKEAENRLRQICESLKEPYRSTGLMYFIKGLSPSEIAQATGDVIKTTETRIYRTKGMVKRLWKEEYK